MRTSLTTLMIAVCLGTLCFSQPAKGGWDPRKEVNKVADNVKDEVNKKKKEAEKAAKKAREKAERAAKEKKEQAERAVKAKKEEAERIAKARKEAAEQAAAKARDDVARTAAKAREDAKQAGMKAREDVKQEALRKRDELLAEAWGEAGRQAYPAGAAIMAGRHNSRPRMMLSADERAVLRPHFGDCVDRVRIVWDALPVNEWTAAGKSIHLGGEKAGAQTYGYSVYVRSSRRQLTDEDRLSTLIHELVHVRQYEKYGSSLSNFGYHYFKKFQQAGLNYDKHAMERTAHGTEDRLLPQVLADFQSRTTTTAIPARVFAK